MGARDAYLWILHGNARAERFYRRNQFQPDGVELSCGPTWYYRSMFRMVREGPAVPVREGQDVRLTPEVEDQPGYSPRIRSS